MSILGVRFVPRDGEETDCQCGAGASYWLDRTDGTDACCVDCYSRLSILDLTTVLQVLHDDVNPHDKIITTLERAFAVAPAKIVAWFDDIESPSGSSYGFWGAPIDLRVSFGIIGRRIDVKLPHRAWTRLYPSVSVKPLRRLLRAKAVEGARIRELDAALELARDVDSALWQVTAPKPDAGHLSRLSDNPVKGT